MSSVNRFSSVLRAMVFGATALVLIDAWAVPLSDRPLFLSGNIKDNLLFDIDDSGSMDFEIISDYYSGSAEYLFNSGGAANNKYDGGWLTNTGGNSTVAFTPKYFYLRSSDYNRQFFNPDSTYLPWPDGSAHTYSDSDPTDALYEANIPTGKSLNLTANTSDGHGHSYWPATYFTKTNNGSVAVTTQDWDFGCASGYTGNFYYGNAYCVRPSPYDYYSTTATQVSSTNTVACTATDTLKNLYSNLGSSSYTFTFSGDAAGIGPDGSCLKRNEIAADTDAMQNFANWFTYYRRRHQAVRGAIGESVKDLSGVRAGIFWLHNQRTIPMRDLDTDKATFLDENYDRFGSNWSGGGTPLRSSLKHAGNQVNSNTDIVTEACQKNFTLLFTDGINNETTSGIGNADESAGEPYEDAYSNTLADVAYHYYTTPLTNLAQGKVPAADGCETANHDPSLDCNTDIHMNTFTIGLGAKGTLGDSYTSVGDAYTSPPTWPDVNSGPEARQVDDLYHAAVDGRGEFYQVDSVDQLRAAMLSAVNDITSEMGSSSNVTFNTATLEAGSTIYAASFNSGKWNGSLKAKTLNENTGAIESLQWDAAAELDARTTDRFIMTYNGDGVPFAWDSLSSAQKDDLRNGGSDALAQQRLAYIRGDRSKEGTLFRTRASRLGDIIDSSPVYVGTPAMGWPDRAPFGASGSRYSAFKSAQAGRTPVVYAGANDGMLHGFNANTGDEVLSYIPGLVYSTQSDRGLHYLTDPNYTHRFYVDQEPVVSDVYINSAWRSILVGGLRFGGRGLFALDVTDPTTFNTTNNNPANIALWEFTNPDLGHVEGTPMVALTKWGNNDYRWSVIVPNGYNSSNGKTGLFVIDIAGGLDGWSSSDYKFIPLETSGGSGLSAIRAVDFEDENGNPSPDGIVDRVYAGDLNGHLWVIDLTGSSNQWGSAYKQGNTPVPLLTATTSSGAAQPITAAPIVAKNIYDSTGASPNLLVYVGTGRYLSDSDPASTQTQSFYGVWDHGQSSLSRSDLVPRTVTDTTVNGSGQEEMFRVTPWTGLQTMAGTSISIRKLVSGLSVRLWCAGAIWYSTPSLRLRRPANQVAPVGTCSFPWTERPRSQPLLMSITTVRLQPKIRWWQAFATIPP